ncbi:MAG: hypothetical protein KJN64_11550 [Ignavibacteria bacterium]|nr:hypothetical protein [Ignavibacteria bacterium]MBT8383639.1 hypothetical protein [Ignavibacteria bacterium]MBT8393167.1 hypothetical protein [Ignavibacteria bacterium]NNJ53776.1 hypothetical protein [Ignavibacteriaceae bacterium]NNL21277.1 hypothetical protein [Ignavibacteriaceae bacterium]
MTKKLEQKLEMLKSSDSSLLEFLKAKFPVFHNSNIFFRDIQYGIRSYLEKKEIKISYQDAEKLAKEMIKLFEEQGLFISINSQSWKVHYPEFVTAEPGDPF